MNGTGATNQSEERSRADKLIEAIVDGGYSDELRNRLKEWILSIPAGGVAEEAIADWAEQNLKPDTSKPGKREIEKFRKLARTLGIEIPAGGMTKRRFIPGLRIGWRVAAAVVPVLVIAGAAFFIFDGEVKEAASEKTVLYADNDSGREMFTLPDGSSVTLENGSRLEYSSDFTSDRRVRLDGEALFVVARDPANPFTVRNENMNVTVLGTEFNVHARNHVCEAEVVLLSGKIDVEICGLHMEMQPGEMLVLDRSNPAQAKPSKAGLGRIMRARHSDLSFNNVQAKEALQIVADYFDKTLVVEPGLQTDDRLNVVLPKELTAENAVASLDRLSEATVCRISGDSIYVVSATRKLN